MQFGPQVVVLAKHFHIASIWVWPVAFVDLVIEAEVVELILEQTTLVGCFREVSLGCGGARDGCQTLGLEALHSCKIQKALLQHGTD